MSDHDPALEKIITDYQEDITRLVQDVQNGYSFTKVSFIYGRLKKLGPWKSEDLSVELILEIDMMQSALAVEYARVFASGSRKVSSDKVPKDLRPTHDAIMDLRNKRYAHDDNHATVDNFAKLRIVGSRVVLEPGANIGIVLGAPAEWDALINWLGEYLHDQSQRQLKRLSEKTGYEWVQPCGPPPDWL